MEKFEIKTDIAGFSVFNNGEFYDRINWREVKQVIAYKADQFTFDDLILGFRTEEEDSFHLINEDMPGFSSLLELMPLRLDLPDPDWWIKVIQPAFKTNLTTIYGFELIAY